MASTVCCLVALTLVLSLGIEAQVVRTNMCELLRQGRCVTGACGTGESTEALSGVILCSGSYVCCVKRPPVTQPTITAKPTTTPATLPPWSPWGPCSVSCGTGVQSRSRDCQTKDGVLSNQCPCYNETSLMEARICSQNPCPDQLCGWTSNSEPGVSPRVLNGQPVSPCTWPWAVHMMLPTVPTGATICSGVLIAPDWVLTTATCMQLKKEVEKAFSISVQLILADAFTNQPDKGERNITLQQIIDHPKFNPTSPLSNNLALLQLTEPVVRGRCNRHVCLPDTNNVSSPSRCVVAGFGPRTAGGIQSGAMYQANVTILETSKCRAVFKKTNSTTLLPNDFLCTDSLQDQTKACSVDEGSFLACQSSSGQWVLKGLDIREPSEETSCSLEVPDLYVDVEGHVDWIRRAMA